MITAEQIKAISPSAHKLDIYLDPLNNAMREFEINTANRVRGFLSQILHESESFLYMKEIATGKEYEGRKDLGNMNPGDGEKYKGRGALQVTGRSMYSQCGKALSLDLISKPELLELPEYAFKASAWVWKHKQLNEVSDVPEDHIFLWKGRKFTKLQWQTFLVNGGFNGIDQRQAFYNKALIAIHT